MMKTTIAALVLVAIAIASVEAGIPGPRCEITKKSCNKMCKKKGWKIYADKR